MKLRAAKPRRSNSMEPEKHTIVNIFSDNAQFLLEQELSIIPCLGKAPLIKGWPTYSQNLPTQSEIQSWSELYPQANIGVVLGKASGIIGIDYDGYAPDERILKYIPKSPIERFGKKGFARFYKHKGEKNRKFKHIDVELFSDGGFIVLPPSIHPDTKLPYKWTGLINFFNMYFKEELTYLDDQCIKNLDRLNDLAKKSAPKTKRKVQSNGVTTTASQGGRNNQLFEMCSGMVGDNTPIGEIKHRLIEYDIKHHSPPWFSDPTETHKGDTDKAVYQMIKRVVGMDKNYNGQGIQVNIDMPETPLKEEAQYLLPSIEFPEPTYLLKSLTDFCLGLSHMKRPTFALASACSLVGTLISNKVTLESISPNLYQLFIADSGGGKDVPLKYPENILAETFNIDYIGMGNYRSDKAIVSGFDKKPVRIDIIDEISKIFKQMNSRGASPYTSNMSEVLTEVWSSSNKIFKGFTTAQGTVGFCFSPCLSLLGATTPDSFSGSFSEENVMQGFGGRFVYIYDIEKKDSFRKKNYSLDDIPEDIVRFVNFLAIEIQVINHEIDVSELKMTTEDVTFKGGEKKKQNIAKIKKPIPRKLIMTQEAEEFLDAIHHEYFNVKDKLVKKTLQPVLKRGYENLLKIAQIHWASRAFLAFSSGQSSECTIFDIQVTKQDLTWAKQYIDASLYDCQRLFDKTLVESKFHKQSVMIENFIESKGGVVTKNQLTKAFNRKFKASELYSTTRGLITAMIECGIIKQTEVDKKNKSGVSFHFSLVNLRKE